MLPQCGAAEAPKDQVLIQVVTGVLDGHVPEETAVRPQDGVRPGLHLPPHPDHGPHSPVVGPGASEWKKVHQHVLWYHRQQGRHNLPVLIQSFQDR